MRRRTLGPGALVGAALWAVGGDRESRAQPGTSTPAVTPPVAPPGTPPVRAEPDPNRPFHFVPPTALVLADAFGPPPAASSIADAADLATVRSVQDTRSPQMAGEAQRDAAREPLPWAETALGPGFARALALRQGAAPADAGEAALATLLERVRHDFDPYAHRSPYPRRPRPQEADPSIQPLVAVQHGAYPSARAAATVIWAEAFGDVHELWRGPLGTLAARSAWWRVVAGVHYPTDLEAGRRLGLAFVAHLRRSPAWAPAVAAARAALQAPPRAS